MEWFLLDTKYCYKERKDQKESWSQGTAIQGQSGNPKWRWKGQSALRGVGMRPAGSESSRTMSQRRQLRLNADNQSTVGGLEQQGNLLSCLDFTLQSRQSSSVYQLVDLGVRSTPKPARFTSIAKRDLRLVPRVGRCMASRPPCPPC